VPPVKPKERPEDEPPKRIAKAPTSSPLDVLSAIITSPLDALTGSGGAGNTDQKPATPPSGETFEGITGTPWRGTAQSKKDLERELKVANAKLPPTTFGQIDEASSIVNPSVAAKGKSQQGSAKEKIEEIVTSSKPTGANQDGKRTKGPKAGPVVKLKEKKKQVTSPSQASEIAKQEQESEKPEEEQAKNAEDKKSEAVKVSESSEPAPLLESLSEDEFAPLSAQEQELAKVEVTEAVRIPLSIKAKRFKASPYTSREDMQKSLNKKGLFSTGGRKSSNRNFWLQVGPFDKEIEAVQHFDKVISRDAYSLRMKTIERHSKTLLRVGSFGSSQEAADACISFKSGDLSCLIVQEVEGNSSALAGNNKNYNRAPMQQPEIQSSPTAQTLYWLQLGSFSSEGNAIKEWKRLRQSHDDLLGSMSVNLQTPQLGGTAKQLFRLRAGPVQSRKDANRMCRELKDRKIPCISVKG
jgi:hypothetical protein